MEDLERFLGLLELKRKSGSITNMRISVKHGCDLIPTGHNDLSTKDNGYREIAFSWYEEGVK